MHGLALPTQDPGHLWCCCDFTAIVTRANFDLAKLKLAWVRLHLIAVYICPIGSWWNEYLRPNSSLLRNQLPPHMLSISFAIEPEKSS